MVENVVSPRGSSAIQISREYFTSKTSYSFSTSPNRNYTISVRSMTSCGKSSESYEITQSCPVRSKGTVTQFFFCLILTALYGYVIVDQLRMRRYSIRFKRKRINSMVLCSAHQHKNCQWDIFQKSLRPLTLCLIYDDRGSVIKKTYSRPSAMLSALKVTDSFSIVNAHHP